MSRKRTRRASFIVITASAAAAAGAAAVGVACSSSSSSGGNAGGDSGVMQNIGSNPGIDATAPIACPAAEPKTGDDCLGGDGLVCKYDGGETPCMQFLTDTAQCNGGTWGVTGESYGCNPGITPDASDDAEAGADDGGDASD